jgi:exosortase
MFPLPYRLSIAMGSTLQRIATLASTFVLQVLGMPAIAEGNVIHINEHSIGIVEACSGLRMLVVFFALSTAVALVTDRRLWERLVIVFSAVPIALMSNLIRVVVTGILHTSVSSEAADAFFHDLAGWFMMPLGLAFLWLEMKILDRLFIEVPEQAPVPFYLGLSK